MSVAYWRLRDRYYRLLGSKCSSCEAEYFPPILVCPGCGSAEIKDHQMPKHGEIMTFTVLREPMAEFADQEPLVYAVVALDNGVRVPGQIVDVPLDQIRIGDRVKAVFRKIKTDSESSQIVYGYKFTSVT